MSQILLLGTQEDSEGIMDQSQEDGTTTININSGSKKLCIRRIHQSRQLQRIGHRSSSTDRTLIFFGGFINVRDGRGLVLAPVLTIILFSFSTFKRQNFENLNLLLTEIGPNHLCYLKLISQSHWVGVLMLEAPTAQGNEQIIATSSDFTIRFAGDARTSQCTIRFGCSSLCCLVLLLPNCTYCTKMGSSALQFSFKKIIAFLNCTFFCSIIQLPIQLLSTIVETLAPVKW